MTPDLANRRTVLYAALGFVLLRRRDGTAPPETEALRQWLDTWRGHDDVVTVCERERAL